MSRLPALLRSSVLASTLTATALGGCVASDEVGVTDTAEELIGGVPASSAHLDAVGSLGTPLSRTPMTPFCTATLITPTVVLTAQHCLEDLTPDQVFFLIGADGRAPKRVVPTARFVIEDTVQGGFIGLGADVAIIHLAQPVNDVRPLGYARLDARRVGDRFTTIGYGVQNADEDSDTRMAGSVTLRGIGGRVFERMFGSIEAFAAEAPNLAPPVKPEEVAPFFAETLFLDDYEALFGNVLGDAQNCFGDSGGPVIQRAGNKLQVVGVVSGGIASNRLLCDYGGVFAVFGPAAFDMIQRETR